MTAYYANAHSVHVEVHGLQPDYEYYYRFRAGGHLSPVGRTRTAPALDVVGRDLLMAFTSYAHFEDGYYTVYRRMAEERPDLILHLGDYIYEGGTRTTEVRQHLGKEIVELEHYRRRYAQYKADPDLQAAHAAAPWLVVPDDHHVYQPTTHHSLVEPGNPAARGAVTSRNGLGSVTYRQKRPRRGVSYSAGPSRARLPSRVGRGEPSSAAFTVA